MPRLHVRMGRTSFGCQPEDLDRLVAFHAPMARIGGWDGSPPEVTKFGRPFAVNRGFCGSDNPSYQAARAKWVRIFSAANCILEAAAMAGCRPDKVMPAARHYGLAVAWGDDTPPMSEAQRRALERRKQNLMAKYAPALDGTHTYESGARLVGVEVDSFQRFVRVNGLQDCVIKGAPGPKKRLNAEIRRG